MNQGYFIGKVQLLHQLQCPICLEDVEDARICPYCSRFYCNKCILNWISNISGSCPNCRAAMDYDALVQGHSINEMQESIKQIFSSVDDNLCDRHKKQQLTLFCYSCEVNICVKCWFSKDHAEHKERVVPLDEAYEYYRQNLKTAQLWVNKLGALNDLKLQQVTKIRQQLSKGSAQIEKLRGASEALVSGEASPAALINILNVLGTEMELCSKYQHETEAIRVDRRGDFMLEPIVLIFRMTRFNKIISANKSYESNAKSRFGFVWKCTIKASDDGDVEVICHFCYLSLTGGTPGKYSVSFNRQPEKVLRFELNEPVMIGFVNPAATVENDTLQVTVKLRQSYTDRIQQWQDDIACFEKSLATQISFRTFRSECEKAMGPPCG